MNNKQFDWRSYTNENGDFQLGNYIHKLINDLMKKSLDMGTLLSDDPSKLRAYRENIKSSFKDRWFDLANAFVEFDILQPCICKTTEFCKLCSGSRYVPSGFLTADQIRSVSMVAIGDNPDVQEKLQKGLERALEIVEGTNRSYE